MAREVGGALYESRFASADLTVSLVISILCIILLLIIQYNGIGKPFIILTTIPLALIGALGGLYITDNPLGFMPQLGVLDRFQGDNETEIPVSLGAADPIL